MHHGVRSCLEYRASGDAERARRASNPDLAPHVAFLDMGGHGYATLRLAADAAECEFVCIPRPLERSAGADGGPLPGRPPRAALVPGRAAAARAADRRRGPRAGALEPTKKSAAPFAGDDPEGDPGPAP
jgi:hypothetical protein